MNDVYSTEGSGASLGCTFTGVNAIQAKADRTRCSSVSAHSTRIQQDVCLFLSFSRWLSTLLTIADRFSFVARQSRTS